MNDQNEEEQTLISTISVKTDIVKNNPNADLQRDKSGGKSQFNDMNKTGKWKTR